MFGGYLLVKKVSTDYSWHMCSQNLDYLYFKCLALNGTTDKLGKVVCLFVWRKCINNGLASGAAKDK